MGQINEILGANARVLASPAPVIGVARLADSGICININPWVKLLDYETATSEINQAVLNGFRTAGIVIQLPQREVRML